MSKESTPPVSLAQEATKGVFAAVGSLVSSYNLYIISQDPQLATERIADLTGHNFGSTAMAVLAQFFAVSTALCAGSSFSKVASESSRRIAIKKAEFEAQKKPISLTPPRPTPISYVDVNTGKPNDRAVARYANALGYTLATALGRKEGDPYTLACSQAILENPTIPDAELEMEARRQMIESPNTDTDGFSGKFREDLGQLIVSGGYVEHLEAVGLDDESIDREYRDDA